VQVLDHGHESKWWWRKPICCACWSQAVHKCGRKTCFLLAAYLIFLVIAAVGVSFVVKYKSWQEATPGISAFTVWSCIYSIWHMCTSGDHFLETQQMHAHNNPGNCVSQNPHVAILVVSPWHRAELQSMVKGSHGS